jgi:LacI family transcriptional regulator
VSKGARSFALDFFRGNRFLAEHVRVAGFLRPAAPARHFTMPTSLRKIAAAAGKSLTTVSLALRNDPEVSEATRRHIQAVAQELGYRMHPGVRTLMEHIRAQRRASYVETLGWVNPHPDPDFFFPKEHEIPNYFQALYLGAKERTAELGYKLDVLHLAAPEMTSRKMDAVIASRGIRGVFIPPLPRAVGHLSLDWTKLAAVAFGYTLRRPRLHRVAPHHHQNMRTILRELHRRRRHRPALLLRPGYDNRVNNHFTAAFSVMGGGEGWRPPPILECEIDETERIVAWLTQHMPDAVVTSGEFKLRALPGMDPEYLQQLELVFVGLQGLEEGVSGITELPELLGAAGVDHLAGQLIRNETGVPDSQQTLLLEGAWLEPLQAQAAGR